MAPADLRRLLLLSALWGGSYLFIRIVVPVFGPVVTVETRVVIAGIILLLYARATKAPLELRARWKQYLLIGLLNSAIPFVLISAAELQLPASLEAILIAASPLFGAIFSAVWLKEPLTARKISGMFVSLMGVGIVVGWSPVRITGSVAAAIGVSLLAAAFYGFAGVYTRVKAAGAPSLGMAVGSQLGASLLLAFAVPFAPVTASPSAASYTCLLALSLLSTALAYILYFQLIVNVGAMKTLTVTFLVPIFGMTWGALFLHEAITMSKLIGCCIILFGTANVTGMAAPWKGIKAK